MKYSASSVSGWRRCCSAAPSAASGRVSAGVALASVGGPACQLGSQIERTPRADAVTRVVPAQVVRAPLASLVVVVVVAASMTVFLSGSVRQRFRVQSVEHIY